MFPQFYDCNYLCFSLEIGFILTYILLDNNDVADMMRKSMKIFSQIGDAEKDESKIASLTVNMHLIICFISNYCKTNRKFNDIVAMIQFQ